MDTYLIGTLMMAATSLFLAFWSMLAINVAGQWTAAKMLDLTIYDISLGSSPACLSIGKRLSLITDIRVGFLPLGSRFVIDEDEYEVLSLPRKIFYLASGPCANLAASFLAFFAIAILAGESFVNALLSGIVIARDLLIFFFRIIFQPSGMITEFGAIQNLPGEIMAEPLYASSPGMAIGFILVIFIFLGPLCNLMEGMIDLMPYSDEKGGKILKEALTGILGKDNPVPKVVCMLCNIGCFVLSAVFLVNIASIIF